MRSQFTRSIINTSIKEAIFFFHNHHFPLPPFAYWTVNDWKNNTVKIDEIFATKLGWDVTDFGSGNFRKIGRIIFTLRNGHAQMRKMYPKPYAHKVMYLLEDQKSPVHYHRSKMEDIINQGGGETVVRVWEKTGKGSLSRKNVSLVVDGVRIFVQAGGTILLKPGQSVTIPPGLYHSYWAERGKGPVLSIEISSVNDDTNDNYFLGRNIRFPKVKEDEEALYLLVSDYDNYLRRKHI